MKIDYTQYHFGDALLPKQYTICGVKLKPFCLGHICLLEQRNNPFINPNSDGYTARQLQHSLFEALLICSMSFEDGYKMLNSPKKYKLLFNLFSINLMLQMFKDKNWNFLTKKNQFIQYMKSFLDMPWYNELHEKKEEEASGTDWKTSLVTTFTKLGRKETEILNMSIKELFYLWTSHIENEGAVRVNNSIEYEQQKTLLEQKKLKGFK